MSQSIRTSKIAIKFYLAFTHCNTGTGSGLARPDGRRRANRRCIPRWTAIRNRSSKWPSPKQQYLHPCWKLYPRSSIARTIRSRDWCVCWRVCWCRWSARAGADEAGAEAHGSDLGARALRARLPPRAAHGAQARMPDPFCIWAKRTNL